MPLTMRKWGIRSQAGRVSAANGEALAEHLDQLESNWRHYSTNARRLAEYCFGAKRFIKSYERLYHEVLDH